eukprot:TRINITY_DN2748_c0_g1_i1.p1 TRINITY_DN2748_c0_g1~~TRINITY_DN2748_c0_g1_i1.p1  ORF type:complete len:952 (+),score=169.18 TRINITY_DN2748_c0_g1_i1:61-2916(+)
MRVIMVAHECGVPQWYWESASPSEARQELESAQQTVCDIANAKKAVSTIKLLEDNIDVECFQQVCEAIIATHRAVDLQTQVENMAHDIPPEALPQKAEAVTETISKLKEESFLTNLSQRCACDALALELEDPSSFISSLEPYVDGEMFSNPPKAFDSTLIGLIKLIAAAHEMTKITVRQNQVRSCLPRLASTESYLSRSGDLPHANIVSFGKLICAVDRVHWKTSVRTRDGVVMDDNNVFFAVASDEGESPAVLRLLSGVVREATALVTGNIYRVGTTNYEPFSPPQPALGCIIKSILKSQDDIDSPAMATQGVQCVHEFMPYISPDRNSGNQIGGFECSAVQSTFLDKLSSALGDENEPVFSFSASPSNRPDKNLIHCLVFVNGKLACCHTKKGNPQLSSTDVYLLSAYVEGLFVLQNGKSYDPGQGAAWDPLAPENLNSKANSRPKLEQVIEAERILAKYDTYERITRSNYGYKEGIVKARLETLQRQHAFEEGRRLREAYKVLVSFGRYTSQEYLNDPEADRSEEKKAAGDDDDDEEAPDREYPPHQQRPRATANLASSLVRPLSPSVALSGPVRAAYDEFRSHQSGHRTASPPDSLDSDSAAHAPPGTRSTLPANTRPVGSLPGTPIMQPSNSSFAGQQSEIGRHQQAVQQQQVQQQPRLPCLRTLWLHNGPGSDRKPFSVFCDSLGNNYDDDPDDPESITDPNKQAELKFSSIRICLIEEIQKTGKGQYTPGPVADCKSRMLQVREELRRKLSPLVDFLTTIEKTHFNLVGGPYMDRCPGLMHFIFIDRTNHNRITNPRILPMRPLEGVECKKGFMQFTAAQQTATEMGLFPKVCILINSAQQLVAKGYTESLWGGSAIQYYHKIWVEADDEEINIDPPLLQVIQTRPWAIRDHLEAINSRDVTRRNIQCFELYVMYIGLLSPEAIQKNNRQLLSLILPSHNKSFD